ncbi:MAG: tryptophan 2,3-dioxygenase family protein [Gemmatimonadetes bacterium]|nr:tryptophan 2,3-dioxygenase family protein [Gemmatimonadota bacterium]MDA1103313.1 tryptophan 2,3-dioxygenase family protein [Gemmatimonadota bacterium]
MSEAVSYGKYLKIEELLSLQQPRDKVEHDEMLFIVIHQVYELWFKVVIHEVDYCCRLLAASDAPRALHTLKRVLTILKVLVAQLDILETMTPTEFLTFRERLDSASGFQSDQFRALEFALGKKSRASVDRFGEGTRARTSLEARWEGATLWDAAMRYLAGEGYAVPEQTLGRDVTQNIEASGEVQAMLMEVYRNDPRNAELCERLVDLDEGIQEWRYRHVKMVERTIGMKQGTGGSAGSAYLRTTLNAPLFPDLWEIRSRL